ncbi:4Fe-4S dicluster domain-containing protein [Chloroflexota bacterium]
MPEKVLVINPEKCTGCRKCEMICSVFHYGASDPSRSLIKIKKWEHIGLYLPVTCQSCDEPFCTEVCPAKACHRDPETNNVIIDRNKCIGCKTCIIACPFGVPLFDKVEHVSVKCDFCGGDPQCVSCCATEAIKYIDIDQIDKDKKREYSVKLAQIRGFGDNEQVMTRISGGFRLGNTT